MKLVMKRVCFIEMEGILLARGQYSPDKQFVSTFLKKLSDFVEKNDIDLYLLSGYHETIAHKEFEAAKLKKYFDKDHFLYVDEEYISSKAEVDEKIHRDTLEKDPEFVDSYFKQIAINNIIKKDSVSKEDVLLLCNDIWVDAYYTTRFSQVDFALFEDNLLERGEKTDMLSGLAYFSLKFDSVKLLLEKFPVVDFASLDKFVFNTMKKVLMKDVDLSGVVKKIAKQKLGEGGLDETKIN